MAVDNVSSLDELDYVPEMPEKPRNIVSIGCGGIVQGSHYPAYKLAGFPVKAVYDLNTETAEKVAAEWNIPHAVKTIAELVEYGTQYDAVYDIATPASVIPEILKQLPDNVGSGGR